MGEKYHALRELCERVGIKRRDLDALLDDGVLSAGLIVHTDGGHRKISDIYEAERQIRAHLEGPGAANGWDLETAKAKREHYEAQRAELKYRAELGELVDRGEVERAYATQVRTLRDRLVQIPGQLAADLAALEETFEVEAILDKAIRDALAEVLVTIAEGAADADLDD